MALAMLASSVEASSVEASSSDMAGRGLGLSGHSATGAAGASFGLSSHAALSEGLGSARGDAPLSSDVVGLCRLEPVRGRGDGDRSDGECQPSILPRLGGIAADAAYTVSTGTVLVVNDTFRLW
jgi:hypothetical protein